MLTYLPQMSPLVPPTASVTRLISMEEEFKASAGRKQHAKASQEPLLVLPNAAASTLPSCVSSKRKSNVLFFKLFIFSDLGRITLLTACLCCVYRQKRREEKEGRSNTEVTFRPNESIIPAQEVKLYLFIYLDRSLRQRE